MRGTAFLFTFAMAAAGQPSDLANQVETVHLSRVTKAATAYDFGAHHKSDELREALNLSPVPLDPTSWAFADPCQLQ